MLASGAFAMKRRGEGIMKYVLSFIAVATLVATAAQARNELPWNTPVKVSGIETVCTGIGSSGDDPRWKAYPVRIEFSNKRHEWVSDVDVVLAKAEGAELARLYCGANWVLFKLAPGDYSVTATVAPGSGGTVIQKFTAPAKGQKRVIVVFTAAATN